MDPKLEAWLGSLSTEDQEKVKKALQGIVDTNPTDPVLIAARQAAGLPAIAPNIDLIRQAAGLDQKEN